MSTFLIVFDSLTVRVVLTRIFLDFLLYSTGVSSAKGYIARHKYILMRELRSRSNEDEPNTLELFSILCRSQTEPISIGESEIPPSEVL